MFDRKTDLERYLKKEEKIITLTMPAQLPAELPETVIFTDSDCRKIIPLLETAASPVKRLIFQGCISHQTIRPWLKKNGYIIYGEDLCPEGESSLCMTTAAVLENMASEREMQISDGAAVAESFFGVSDEELLNEFPLLLRVENNTLLPVLLYNSLTELEKRAAELSDDAPARQELLLKKDRISLMVQNIFTMQ